MSLSASAIESLLALDVAAASADVGVALAEPGAWSTALLRARLDDLRARPAALPWLLRVIALREEPRRMIGLAGFHGPPDITGSVEVGYEIAPAWRRQGYASEATAALVAWALSQPGVRRVVAAVRRDNVGSLRVLGRLGFAPIGTRWDAIEGATLLFERRTPCGPLDRGAPDRGPGEDAKMPAGGRDQLAP